MHSQRIFLEKKPHIKKHYPTFPTYQYFRVEFHFRRTTPCTILLRAFILRTITHSIHLPIYYITVNVTRLEELSRTRAADPALQRH